jgi:methyl-accepting chemotaxis protein
MKKLSLKVKLGLSFGSLLLTLVALGTVAYRSVGQLGDTSKGVAAMMEKKDMATGIEAAIEKQTTGARGFLLAGQEDLLKDDEEGKQEFADKMDRMGNMLVTEQGKKLHAEIRSAYDQYRPIVDREIGLRRAGKTQEAVGLAFSPETA